MTSQTSYFSVSLPLIRENLRRFWAIPAISFLIYFLSGVFPILISYGEINRVASYIRMSLTNMQPFFMAAHLMMPILTAVVIFRYLQTTSSVTMMHALPFSRYRLYNSNLLSGLILITLPLLINGLILLVIAKPAYDQWAYDSPLVTDKVDLFTRTAVLEWLWQSFLILLVVYAISVFAGLVTANSIMHYATAIGFNFLVPGLYSVFMYYFGLYLYGFNLAGDWGSTALSISPFLEVFNDRANDGSFPLLHQVYYLLNALVLFALSSFLYSRRKLEKASESLAFQFMVPIICYLVAFFGMTLLGVWFQSLNQDSSFYAYAGYAAGALIFFLIGRMIVTKTPRIFNLSTLKTFGIYALLAVLFFTGLQFDLTGFEKRIPAKEKIQSVNLENTFLFSMNEKYAMPLYWDGNPTNRYRMNSTLQSAENVELIQDLHASILEHRAEFESNQGKYMQHNLNLEYTFGKYSDMDRSYTVDYYFLRDSQEMKKIYESEEFKSKYLLKSLNPQQINSISLMNPVHYETAPIVRNPADMATLIALLDQDYLHETYADAMSLDWPTAYASINYKGVEPDTGRPYDYVSTIVIRHSYENTLKWLEQKGYLEAIQLRDDMITHIGINYAGPMNTGSDYPYYPEPAEQYYKETSEGTEMFQYTVTDPDQIKEMMKYGKSQNTTYTDYYYGTIFYKYPDGSGYEGDYLTLPIYFNPGEVPDFILEHFDNR